MSTTTRTSRALLDLFRCPEGFAGVSPTDESRPPAGFFRFGECVLWGANAAGAASASADLRDLSGLARADGEGVVLPFELDQVVENLRWERYLEAGPVRQTGLPRSLLRQAYYLLRPLLGVGVRKHLQRAYLRSWRAIPFPRWPVDFTVEELTTTVLGMAMRSAGVSRAPFIWFWPEGQTAAVMMTHDVETAGGRDFCAALMDEDQRAGLPSAFHIIPEERYEVPATFLEGLRRRGFEINVHGLNHDGRLFTDYGLFRARAERINDYARRFGARGFRSPVMYRNLDWLHHLEIEYDMSVPNVAHLDPQRGGCCTVFPYFVGEILELPLTTTQDYSLLNILKDEGFELWRRQIEMIVRRHGLLSFNTHPDYLRKPHEMGLYRQLLEHLAGLRRSQRLWFALPGEINDWWRQRARMRLVRDGEGWRIEGEGSGRARLAEAVLEGGALSLRLTGGGAAPAV